VNNTPTAAEVSMDGVSIEQNRSMHDGSANADDRCEQVSTLYGSRCSIPHLGLGLEQQLYSIDARRSAG